MILGGLLLSTDYCLGAAVRLDRRQADPRASAAACCRSARPTPRSSTSGAPISTTSRSTTTTARSPFACRAGPPTTKTTKRKTKPTTSRETKDDEAGRRRPEGPRLARRHQPAEAQGPPRRSSRNWTNRTWAESTSDYELPSLDLLVQGETVQLRGAGEGGPPQGEDPGKDLPDFGFNIRVVEIQTGPVIAQFEVELEAGLRLSKITGLADDLAIALRVPSVRIVAPLPGKNTVGIEVPNNERQIVRLREVMEEANGKAQKMRIPIYLGKDVAGNPLVVDLTTLPHLLIAGRTGTGKSVCLNSIIVSMLMTRRPDEVRMLMIDPKMVELSPYKCLPHLMHPVVTDMRKAEAILGWAVEKMEERYHLLARAGVRHISVYNQLGEEELMERIQPEDDEERKQIPTHMPYIVIVADELADLMMTAAKEVEGHIIRLAQKSRAVGIHLVLATQKPTVDVITGLIKSNLPARIAFQVASRTDSRVVLDEMGADKLLGNGDMLFLWPGTSTLLRGQGTYLSDDEITRVIAAVATTEPQFVKELVQLKTTLPDGDRQEVQRPRRAVRGGHRHRGPRGPRQRVAVAAGAGHRLRPGRPADRLHGRGRHRRPLQRLAGPRNPHDARTMGADDRPRLGRCRFGRLGETAAEQQDSDVAPAEERMSPGAVRTVKPVDDEDEEPDDEYDDEDEEPPFDEDEPDDEEDGERRGRRGLGRGLDAEDSAEEEEEEEPLDDNPTSAASSEASSSEESRLISTGHLLSRRDIR